MILNFKDDKTAPVIGFTFQRTPRGLPAKTISSLKINLLFN